MDINELIKQLSGLPADELDKIKSGISDSIENAGYSKWIPTVGPQEEAFNSKADCMLFGGEPGGGKTALAVGLAFTSHKRSLILRRQ